MNLHCVQGTDASPLAQKSSMTAGCRLWLANRRVLALSAAELKNVEAEQHRLTH
jgi:hypothetical protein